MKILMVNWPHEERELIKNLRTLGLKVEVLYEDVRRINVDPLKVYDIVYISHVGPEPLLAISTLIRHQNRRPMVVYGNLEPLIATPYRLSNIIYNIKSTLKLAILKFLKVEAIHVLNSFEYKVLRYMGFRNVFLIPYGVSKPELSTSLVKAPVFTMVYVTPEYRKGAEYSV